MIGNQNHSAHSCASKSRFNEPPGHLQKDGGVIKKLLVAGEGWELPQKDDKVIGMFRGSWYVCSFRVGHLCPPVRVPVVRILFVVDFPYDSAVHYTGTLEDGTKFDSSVDRGEPFEFTLGHSQVIKGWDVAVSTMKKGEKVQIKLRHDYAYGESGSPPKIPPGATLVRLQGLLVQAHAFCHSFATEWTLFHCNFEIHCVVVCSSSRWSCSDGNR